MKLGEMLIRDGRLSEEELREGLARQARDGGRLGTVLVEMGLIDLDTLTVYLGLELGIPIATRATLERAKRTAVRLLTPEQALLFRCIPIVIQDRQLIAAVDNPLDLATMDQIGRITGYRVLPRVAAEIRIFLYLERYYGVPRPTRFGSIDDPLDLTEHDSRDLPAPPLPGLPPRADDDSRSDRTQPIPALRVSTMERQPAAAHESTRSDDSGEMEGGAAVLSPEHEALASDADALASALESDAAARAEEAPRTEPDRAALRQAVSLEMEAPEFYEPLGLDAALKAMHDATRRGEVADAVMSYAAGLFHVAALCILRDNMAFGWKAVGPNLDRERIEALLIPLDAPSMFQMAIHKDNLFHAVPVPSTLHTYLYRVLRCEPPDRATVAVISIGQRVVNLLYGHRSERGDLTARQLAGLRRVCAEASASYVRLIATSKHTGPEDLSPVDGVPGADGAAAGVPGADGAAAGMPGADGAGAATPEAGAATPEAGAAEPDSSNSDTES